MITAVAPQIVFPRYVNRHPSRSTPSNLCRSTLRFRVSKKNSSGTVNTSATSSGLGVIEGRALNNPTTGVMRNPVGVARSSRRPMVLTVAGWIPVSSSISLSAVATMFSSAPSTTPPGKEICPLCVSTMWVLRVKSKSCVPRLSITGTSTPARWNPGRSGSAWRFPARRFDSRSRNTLSSVID